MNYVSESRKEQQHKKPKKEAILSSKQFLSKKEVWGEKRKEKSLKNY
jgi:hypothetical protein